MPSLIHRTAKISQPKNCKKLLCGENKIRQNSFRLQRSLNGTILCIGETINITNFPRKSFMFDIEKKKSVSQVRTYIYMTEQTHVIYIIFPNTQRSIEHIIMGVKQSNNDRCWSRDMISCRVGFPSLPPLIIV